MIPIHNFRDILYNWHRCNHLNQLGTIQFPLSLYFARNYFHFMILQFILITVSSIILF